MPRCMILFQSQIKFKCWYCIRITLYLWQFPAYTICFEANKQGATSVIKKYHIHRRHNILWEKVRKQLLNKKIAYLRPQGSFSAILSTVLAILGKRSAGNRTSPHANCTCFARLSSTSNRFARAWQAPSNSSATVPAKHKKYTFR